MKKIVLMILSTFCLIELNYSQELGNTLFGGNFDFSSENDKTNTNDESTIQLSVTPVIGIMINSNVAIGMAVGVTYSKYEKNILNSSTSGDSKTLSLSPFVRIHNNITENFKYYIEPNFGKTFILGDNSDDKTQIYNIGVNVGLLYFVTQKMSLELSIAGLNYIHISDKDYDVKSDYVMIKYDLITPNIGLKYYL